MRRYRLHSLVRTVAGLSCLLILASCAALTSPPKLIIDGLIFRNQTGATVQNVQVHVKKTSAFANCSPVLAGSECTTTFKPFPYKGNTLSISWKKDGKAETTEDLHAELPNRITPEQTAKLLVVIKRTGTATARLIQ